MRISVVILVLAAAAVGLAGTPQADLIVVEKAKRTLSLYRQGELLKSYRVALGTQPVGPKRRRGDHKTPEGEYVIDRRLPQSQFHRALHISYPNADDRALAKASGADPGDAIMLHGLPNGQGGVGAAHRASDWTDGCIAVTNAEIEEIWSLAPDGTRISIRP